MLKIERFVGGRVRAGGTIKLRRARPKTETFGWESPNLRARCQGSTLPARSLAEPASLSAHPPFMAGPSGASDDLTDPADAASLGGLGTLPLRFQSLRKPRRRQRVSQLGHMRLQMTAERINGGGGAIIPSDTSYNLLVKELKVKPGPRQNSSFPQETTPG